MRKTLLALVCLVATLSATAQSQEPNTVRYFLNDKTVFDIRLSELEQIKRIGKFGLRNVYSAEDKNSKDFLYSQIDSIMFVYVKYDDEVAPDVTNANRNQNPKAQGLEFPRLRSGSDQLLVQHSTKDYGITYSLEWDCTKKSQRWTCYQFHKGLPNNNVGRNESWKDDDQIPSKFQTHTGEYSGTGFSKGHMCMSNDRQSSVEQNKQTFYISNIHPQYQNHNGNLWQTLENTVRGWGFNNTFRDTLYVVKAGTIDGDKVLSPTKTGLLVPKYFYMAVLCYKGDSYKAIAFWTEHTNAKITKANPADYAISVKELEELTGIDFFCNLPDDIEKNVEENLTLSDWGLKKTGE